MVRGPTLWPYVEAGLCGCRANFPNVDLDLGYEAGSTLPTVNYMLQIPGAFFYGQQCI